MSSTAEEIQTKIDEIYSNLTEANGKINDALQGAVDKIFGQWWIPGWLKDRAEEKAQEAWAKYQTIPPKLDPATEWILREINDYNAVKATGPQYCGVDFSVAAAAVGQGALGPRGDDWDSGNTQNYRNAVQSLPTKLQNLQDAVEDICEILSDLTGDYESYFLGVLVAVISLALAIAGLVAAIVGLVLAIPSGGGGLVVSIIGLVVAVLAAVVAVIAFATLTDIDASRATAAQRLDAAATSVRNSPWPVKPALDSGDWR
ncbi:hypothetical protein [Tessaracoccus antarcticus]|uniref:Uncharacterized protein n=1 Tax=Tessaracoccus antarcticus TaxID=2479848 RepID=A0A3M0GGJ5_9ACTN|nr:hypothetical protein [Tessaracoccus antarcticus]RMB61832.1 hypothetical protein EAX62_04270 [Tessaracoccus antarcticus]